MREAARVVKCQDRLADMAAAAMVYEVVTGRLPAELSAEGAVDFNDFTQSGLTDGGPGGLFNTPNEDSFYRNQHTSLHVQIAPFMGLYEIVEDVDPIVFDFERNLIDYEPCENSIDLYFGTEGCATSLLVDVSEFTCPSDRVNDIETIASGMMGAVFCFQPRY